MQALFYFHIQCSLEPFSDYLKKLTLSVLPTYLFKCEDMCSTLEVLSFAPETRHACCLRPSTTQPCYACCCPLPRPNPSQPPLASPELLRPLCSASLQDRDPPAPKHNLQFSLLFRPDTPLKTCCVKKWIKVDGYSIIAFFRLWQTLENQSGCRKKNALRTMLHL